MALGKLFKSIFGAGSGSTREKTSDPIDYQGFSIEAAPIDEDGKYRTAGCISGEIDGEPKRVRFIRADQNAELQVAIEHSISKARQIIDEQGQALLNKTHL